jgi:hypothetical protein
VLGHSTHIKTNEKGAKKDFDKFLIKLICSDVIDELLNVVMDTLGVCW